MPVRQETVDLPEDALVCACCGKPFEDIGHNDDGEQIEIETTVYRKVVRRKRYRRTCDCRQLPRTVTAPLPPKLLPKSRYDTSIWTHLLLEKFHLQRPLHRTIEQLRLSGLSPAPGTIADGFKRIEPLMTPIYEAIRIHHVQSAYFHADETRSQSLRQATGTPEFLAADALLREHVDSMVAQRNAELADAKLREPCRKALASLNEHWNGLTLFVDDPRIPLDNNYGERLIRGPAVGRKNYNGSVAEWSGRLAMMMFSIFATLVHWKINPRAWLN